MLRPPAAWRGFCCAACCGESGFCGAALSSCADVALDSRLCKPLCEHLPLLYGCPPPLPHAHVGDSQPHQETKHNLRDETSAVVVMVCKVVGKANAIAIATEVHLPT